jgi:hypothetical protein
MNVSGKDCPAQWNTVKKWDLVSNQQISNILGSGHTLKNYMSFCLQVMYVGGCVDGYMENIQKFMSTCIMVKIKTEVYLRSSQLIQLKRTIVSSLLVSNITPIFKRSLHILLMIA